MHKYCTSSEAGASQREHWLPAKPGRQTHVSEPDSVTDTPFPEHARWEQSASPGWRSRSHRQVLLSSINTPPPEQRRSLRVSAAQLSSTWSSTGSVSSGLVELAYRALCAAIWSRSAAASARKSKSSKLAPQTSSSAVRAASIANKSSAVLTSPGCAALSSAAAYSWVSDEISGSIVDCCTAAHNATQQTVDSLYGAYSV